MIRILRWNESWLLKLNMQLHLNNSLNVYTLENNSLCFVKEMMDFGVVSSICYIEAKRGNFKLEEVIRYSTVLL